LFSTFADGWPGTGLLLQRFLIGAVLLRGAWLEQATNSHSAAVVLPLIGSVLLLIGLGTPYVGVLVAATRLWDVFSSSADPWTAMIVCGLAISLAMIGPGAWSVDAHIFGRKHVEIVRK